MFVAKLSKRLALQEIASNITTVPFAQLGQDRLDELVGVERQVRPDIGRGETTLVSALEPHLLATGASTFPVHIPMDRTGQRLAELGVVGLDGLEQGRVLATLPLVGR
jgi:hypothetical protein